MDLNDGTIRRRAPANTAALTDYYAVGDGHERHTVKAYLSAVEGRAAPVIDKILNDATEGPGLSAEEKAALSRFVALQVARVPGFLNRIQEFMTGIGRAIGSLMIQTRERYETELRRISPEREYTPSEIDALYEGALALAPAISSTPIAALGPALRSVPKIANLMWKMSWAIMTPASSGNLWTSDNPVYWINPDATDPVIGHGLGARSIEVNFPIGRQRCLLLTWSDFDGHGSISDLRIAQERGIVGATKYLFCGCKADAEQALAAHRRMYPHRGGVS